MYVREPHTHVRRHASQTNLWFLACIRTSYKHGNYTSMHDPAIRLNTRSCSNGNNLEDDQELLGSYSARSRIYWGAVPTAQPRGIRATSPGLLAPTVCCVAMMIADRHYDDRDHRHDVLAAKLKGRTISSTPTR